MGAAAPKAPSPCEAACATFRFHTIPAASAKDVTPAGIANRFALVTNELVVAAIVFLLLDSKMFACIQTEMIG
jgi:hypothetical protein